MVWVCWLLGTSVWKPQTLRLDKQERLFPGPTHPGREQSAHFAVDGSWDLLREEDELVSYQRICRKQLG